MTGFYETKAQRIDKQIDDVEVRVGIWREEELEEKLETLQEYARRIHCGAILNGCFVEREVPSRQAILSYNILSEINAGNYLARRSFEAMQATEGWYEGHRVMLEAAREGANPSGLLNRIFRKGNREVAMGSEYIKMQASTNVWYRLHAKIEDMNKNGNY